MGSDKRSSGMALIRGMEERKPPLIFTLETRRPMLSEMMGELKTPAILKKQ
jgi:hypothetical protein